MGDEFYRQYSTVLQCWKYVMCLECDAVLFQNLSHNLIKSEFHVQTNDLFIFHNESQAVLLGDSK
jgi:hypothetical protein